MVWLRLKFLLGGGSMELMKGLRWVESGLCWLNLFMVVKVMRIMVISVRFIRIVV